MTRFVIILEKGEVVNDGVEDEKKEKDTYDKDKKILAVDHSPRCNYWCNVRADASAGGCAVCNSQIGPSDCGIDVIDHDRRVSS